MNLVCRTQKGKKTQTFNSFKRLTRFILLRRRKEIISNQQHPTDNVFDKRNEHQILIEKKGMIFLLKSIPVQTTLSLVFPCQDITHLPLKST